MSRLAERRAALTRAALREWPAPRRPSLAGSALVLACVVLAGLFVYVLLTPA